MKIKNSIVNLFNKHVLLTLISVFAIGTASFGEKVIAEEIAVKATTAASKLSPKDEFSGLLIKAQAGDADAQFSVGMSYLYYLTAEVKRDTGQAVEWLKKSATQGNPKAQSELGYLYTKNGGLLWGKILAENPRTAIEWLQKAVAKGNATAQNRLGDIFYYGNGVPINLAKAFDLYRLAAIQGDSQGETNLGSMYDEGKGVSKDAKKAVEWYKKAASQGHMQAQLNLGEIYYDGRGVARDFVAAASYYEKAASSGYSEAFYPIGYLYANGKGVPKNSLVAAKWLGKAASGGHPRAQAMLGSMYSEGDGVPRDKVLAYAWMNLAAGNGDELAVTIRDVYEKLMSSDEKAESQRLTAKWRPSNGFTPTSITMQRENSTSNPSVNSK